MTDLHKTDLPHPDSPTMASVSPLLRDSETSPDGLNGSVGRVEMNGNVFQFQYGVHVFLGAPKTATGAARRMSRTALLRAVSGSASSLRCST